MFGVSIPKSCPNVPRNVLNPRSTWEDKGAYDETARKLARLFQENFKKFQGEVTEDIASAGPVVK
jgi:phosphoenolpyruvate carboxykinase (ATP)